jgi:sugar O-acyltransferase (sialic acid O-acetyltransferase NeuD family)
VTTNDPQYDSSPSEDRPIPSEVVLFGVGSSFVVEYEETCLRLGVNIVAYVRNSEDPVVASDISRIMTLEEMAPEWMLKPVAFPLVTPGYRKNVFDQAVKCGFARFPALVDPTSILASTTQIGRGTFINAGCTIGASCTIGEFVLVNRHASLAHHVTVCDYASIGPGVITSGRVYIGTGAFIGTGAVLLPDISVGANSVVAAGAVVTTDVAENSLVAGNPARVIKTGIPGHNNSGVQG